MHHGIATAIASDFLNRRRSRNEFPEGEANLAIFHRKMHRNRHRIVTAEKSQPIPQKESRRAIWPRKRIAEFDSKSSPADGALRPKSMMSQAARGLEIPATGPVVLWQEMKLF